MSTLKTPMTQSDINVARYLLEHRGPSAMYNHLANFGDRYAKLADGVTQGNTLSGVAALEFMKNTAEQQGISLSTADIDAIRVDMAKGYLDTLQTILDIPENHGMVVQEITAKEARQFHGQVFKDHRLDIDAWTLNTPFRLLGDEAAQRYWENLLDTAGDRESELGLALETMARMAAMHQSLQLLGTYAKNGEMLNTAIHGIETWLSRLANVDTALAMAGISVETWFNYADFITSANGSNPYATPAISPTLGTTPDPLVKTIRWITKDPLVLDLDGDGLEITPLKAGVMFDADGDTVKNASAWIGADDGLLVRDLDGNGVIDSGRELFGDNTRLTNGKTAAHGFAALADLDTGSVIDGANGVMVGARDGVIDARDAGFSALRVWRDLDQDGVSQANELATLTDADIAAIGLSNTATSKNYGGDATQTRSGSYTRTDGSTGEAGNFLLAVNYFERAFAPVEVSEAARALPDFKGTGWVRDLREAATLEPGLIDLVAQADHAPTRAGYKAAIGDLIKAWALASDYASAGRQGMAQGYGLILSEPVDAQERGWMDVAANDANGWMRNAA